MLPHTIALTNLFYRDDPSCEATLLSKVFCGAPRTVRRWSSYPRASSRWDRQVMKKSRSENAPRTVRRWSSYPLYRSAILQDLSPPTELHNRRHWAPQKIVGSLGGTIASRSADD